MMKFFTALLGLTVLAALGCQQNKQKSTQMIILKTASTYFKAICYHPVSVGDTLAQLGNVGRGSRPDERGRDHNNPSICPHH